MRDKKQKSDASTLKSRLQEVTLDPDLATQVFPTVQPGSYTTLVVFLDETPVAYLAMELPIGPTCALHLNILQKYRTKEVIQDLVSVFYKDVHPWIHAKGKQYVIVTCPYQDTKTMELFKTFGFDPSGLWMGLMPIQEDAWEPQSQPLVRLS